MFRKLQDWLSEDEIRRQEEQRRQWANPVSIDGVKMVAILCIFAGVVIAIAGFAGADYFWDQYQHQFTPPDVVFQGVGMIVIGFALLIAFREKKKK